MEFILFSLMKELSDYSLAVQDELCPVLFGLLVLNVYPK